MTTTETVSDAKKEWAEVAAVANEPPPRRYTERLSCKLTPQERYEAFEGHRALQKKIRAYEDKTKTMMAERKAGLAKLEEEEKLLGDAIDSGEVEREVEIEENVSFRQGRRWKVRLDTNETFFEKSLEPGERQAALPGVNDKQLPLAPQASAAPDENFAEPDDDTTIDDPEALLGEATDDSGDDDDDMDDLDDEEG